VTYYKELIESIRSVLSKTPEPEKIQLRKSVTLQIIKAWTIEDRLYTEGWISTDAPDLQGDDIPPEAFLPVLPPFFESKPIAVLNHERDEVGYVQKAALVRDGRIFHEENYQDDLADFEHFPASGTGVYGRVCVRNPTAVEAIQKATSGGFSFQASISRSNTIRRPDGGRHIVVLDRLDEVTIAIPPNIPVNPQAQILHIS
jgi:hypothetical protein